MLVCLLLSPKVSPLLGRIPSAVGYQPTLATDMSTMQERMTTTKKGSMHRGGGGGGGGGGWWMCGLTDRLMSVHVHLAFEKFK